MIMTVSELKQFPEFADQDETVLKAKLDGLEISIREMTNNNFQNRFIRFSASSDGNILNGVSPFLRVGDTVQVSESGVNDGLYVVTAISDDSITVDKTMFAVDRNLVTKVEYTSDIKQGIVNLLKWDIENGSKSGIQSETISRHSVTYTSDTSKKLGFPVSLLDFLTPYRKARF